LFSLIRVVLVNTDTHAVIAHSRKLKLFFHMSRQLASKLKVMQHGCEAARLRGCSLHTKPPEGTANLCRAQKQWLQSHQKLGASTNTWRRLSARRIGSIHGDACYAEAAWYRPVIDREQLPFAQNALTVAFLNIEPLGSELWGKIPGKCRATIGILPANDRPKWFNT
jgi:hypothetical protein